MNTRKIQKPLPCFLTLPLSLLPSSPPPSFSLALTLLPPLHAVLPVTPGLYRVVVVPA